MDIEQDPESRWHVIVTADNFAEEATMVTSIRPTLLLSGSFLAVRLAQSCFNTEQDYPHSTTMSRRQLGIIERGLHRQIRSGSYDDTTIAMAAVINQFKHPE